MMLILRSTTRPICATWICLQESTPWYRC